MTNRHKSYLVGQDRIPADNITEAVLQASKMLNKEELGSSVSIYEAKKKETLKGRV